MQDKPDKRNGGQILAVVLIAIGIIWLLQKLTIYAEFPVISWQNFYFPFQPAFTGLKHFIFSWPIILIIVGLVLMAGRRKAGVVLIVIGGIFLIPKIIHIPVVTATLIMPVLLITIGIILIAKFLTNNSQN